MKRIVVLLPVALAPLLLLLFAPAARPTTDAADVITSPDTGAGDGTLGTHSSLELDANGFPVVSYYDITTRDLKILRCDDPNCAGSGESVTSPDTFNTVGQSTSLELDINGFPVVSYFYESEGDLKILHCDDANCSPGGNSVTSPDTVGSVGRHTSLVLDSNGFPVVSYVDDTSGDLKILHCNDANCAPGGDSITSPDTGGTVGEQSSVALDASGFPVVSYWDRTNDDLRVLHCDDANCANGGESLTSPDTVGSVGTSSSIVLDASGRPVVSYRSSTLGDLKILHCDDPNCVLGGDSVTSPDTVGSVGVFTSLQLDSNGFPVVSHIELGGAGAFKILHCDDVNCAPGGDSITSPGVAGGANGVGEVTSLALDASGFPVATFYDLNNADLKILHCDDANCSPGGESLTSPDPGEAIVGPDTSLALDSNGFPVVSYTDESNGKLKILHCSDPDCTHGGRSIAAPDSAGAFAGTSLQLDSNGRPVVSYYHPTRQTLRILHCDDPNCAAGGDAISAPESSNGRGYFSSLRLDSNGFPVVSYFDLVNGDLKILHCDDPNCAPGGDSMTSPDTGGVVGSYTALVLDGNGFPVVSYFDQSNGDLKILHCDDPNCAGAGDVIVAADSTNVVGMVSSLELDANGFPVVSYLDDTLRDLKILHCDDPNCAPGGNSITIPDIGNGFTRPWSSIRMGCPWLATSTAVSRSCTATTRTVRAEAIA